MSSRAVAPLTDPYRDLRAYRETRWLGGLQMEVERRTVTVRTRRIVRARDRQCFYCGDPAGPYEFDHRVPRRMGGGNGPDNIVLACRPCNSSKAGRELTEWLRA